MTLCMGPEDRENGDKVAITEMGPGVKAEEEAMIESTATAIGRLDGETETTKEYMTENGAEIGATKDEMTEIGAEREEMIETGTGVITDKKEKEDKATMDIVDIETEAEMTVEEETGVWKEKATKIIEMKAGIETQQEGDRKTRRRE